jgi:hypothetical protein
MSLKPTSYTLWLSEFSGKHVCKFMPPGYRVERHKPDRWRLDFDDDSGYPRVNFCPYCGVKLCEPEIP